MLLLFATNCGYSDPYTPPGSNAIVEQPAAAPSQDAFSQGANLPQSTLPDGLKYADIKVGSGTLAATGSNFSAYYTLYLADGTKVDSNLDPGKPQLQGVLDNSGSLIPGFVEGVKGMRVGGKRRIFIPGNTSLGYGANPPPGKIPPNADLIFLVQLAAVK
ncbi:MAG: FKBP-type peptidyl-prolyl cis-trans isomerase [Candidatus Dormibacteraceae bacterium]